MRALPRIALLAVATVVATVAPAGVTAPATAATPAAAAAPAAPPRPGGDELVGTYQRVAKDLVQPDGTLRDVYSDLLLTGRGAYRLKLPKGTRLAGGTPVRVRGRLAGQDMEAAEVTAVGAPARVPTTGTTKVLVILAYWTAPDGMTLTHARNQVFGDDHTWFGETSYGQLGLTGDATGWHQIPAPPGGQCFSGHWEIMNEAKAKAKAAGYDSVTYDRTMVYFPQCGGDATGAAGWAYQPGTDVWLNGYFDRRVSVHEQGHNYGVAHAHSLHCTAGDVAVSVGGSCSSVEYGDDYDAMGGSQYAAHFSPAQKNQLGWLTGRYRTLGAAATTFTLPPYEQPAATPLAAVVPTGVAGRAYWIEHRRALGMDSTLPSGATNGVLVRLVDPALLPDDDAPFLLDMTPQNPFGDAVIPPGGTWTSPEGVRIAVAGVTGAGAEVTVEGGAEPPTVPTVPRNVVATGGDEAVRLTWDPPASNGGATVQSYAVLRTPGNVRTTVTDATSTTIGGLTNGTPYTFTVAATNSVGTGPASAGVSATPAVQVPAVAVTAPAEGATVSGTVALAATATPHPVSQAAIELVEFSVDGEVVDWDYEAPFTGSWDSAWSADGPHTVTATAYDSADRLATSAPVGVTVTIPRPTITITAPSDGTVVTEDLVTLEAASAPVAGGAPIESVTYETLDGTVVGWAGAQAPHTAQWDVSGVSGARTIVAKATDGDGRTGTSAPVTVTVDRPLPSVALTAPADGATVSGVVTVAASASPDTRSGAAIDRVDFLADGWNYLGTDFEAPYEVAWDVAALSGAHTLTAVAYDVDGRYATSAARTVTVDNPAPAVTVTSPARGAAVSGTVTFTASVTPGAAPVERVEFTVDGGAPLAATGAYTATWDSRTLPGEHVVTATAYDTAGRSGTSEPVPFTVRIPEPTAVITQPTAGGVVRPGARTLALAAAPDPVSNAAVVSATFRVDGVVAGTDSRPADGFAVPWTASRGEHVVTAEVTDADGFTGSALPVEVLVADPPGAPTGLTAAAGSDGSARLTFAAPADDGGRPVTGYVVQVSDGSERAATGSPVTVAGLANGTRYTFRVKALTSAGESAYTAASNAVVPGTATALGSLTLSAPTVDSGRSVTLSGTLTGAGTPLSGRRVQLLACAPGSSTSCSVVKTGTTSDVGRVALAYVPPRHRDLRLRYVPTGDRYLGSTSAAKRVSVRAVVSSAVSATTVPLGRTVTVSGKVSPAHAGKLVYLQRLTSTGWKPVTDKAQSTTGAVAFAVKPATRGRHYYRLYFAGDGDHLAGTSPARSFSVT